MEVFGILRTFPEARSENRPKLGARPDTLFGIVGNIGRKAEIPKNVRVGLKEPLKKWRETERRSQAVQRS